MMLVGHEICRSFCVGAVCHTMLPVEFMGVGRSLAQVDDLVWRQSRKGGDNDPILFLKTFGRRSMKMIWFGGAT